MSAQLVLPPTLVSSVMHVLTEQKVSNEVQGLEVQGEH